MAGIGRSFKANLQSALAEHGKTFTDSVEKCNEVLLSVAGNATEPLRFDSEFVAQVLITILNHSLPDISNEPDAWSKGTFESLSAVLNPEVLIESLKALTRADINWSEVIHAFQETSEFTVRDKAGLYFLMNAIQPPSSPGYFPVDQLYQLWPDNRLGQLSWIGQLLSNSDLFCFADYPHRALSTSALKIPPDENNKDICNWLSLDLIQIILQLLDSYPTLVFEILAGRKNRDSLPTSGPPASICPDLLLLGLLQVGLPLTSHRASLAKVLISQLMAHHTNAVSVLNVLWNWESAEGKKVYQQLAVQGLLLFYSSAPDDMQRLTKILEVAHELKPNGLGELFNVPNFQFAVDLACLASRRDFLKLDKFLGDKLQEHDDKFAKELVSFIIKRYPAHMVPANVNPLNFEIFQTMFQALSNCSQYSNNVHNEFLKLQMHLKQATKPADPHINSRTPINAFTGQPPTNQFGYGRSIEPPGVPLGSNGSMTTPVFGTGPNGRSLGASTPTTPYSYPSNQLIPGSMDIRGQMSDSIYRNMGPPGWSSAGWGTSSRSTPISDFRPSFAQHSMGNAAVQQALQMGNGLDQGFPEPTPEIFTEEIQNEANSYFQHMFTDHNPLSVADFIKHMSSFRHSNNPKHKKILKCVIKNLFDEFKFFPEYPEFELQTTAEVYGGFINEQIVDNLDFAQAMRKVLEALQNPPHSMLFKFGIIALQSCKGVLHQWPKVCHILTTNESFPKFPSDLQAYILAGVNTVLPENVTPEMHQAMLQYEIQNRHSSMMASHDAVQNAVMQNMNIPQHGPSMMAVSNTEILERGTERDGEKVTLSETKLAEEVSFLCNNLSFSNMTSKVDDLKRILDQHDDTCRKWLAQYLVMKRITLEQNFHALYNSFLAVLDDKQLNLYVKQETLRNIKILLKSDKKHDTSSFDDRQLLKNLGHWLGLITIGRNQPLVLDELNLRDLLLEAFYKGQQELLYVIPFVAKIIMASQKSGVFSPSCAWVQQILHILAEIHRQSDLKLALKFEIEVLCKELRVDLNSLVTDGSLLTDERITGLSEQLSDVAILTRPTESQSGDDSHLVGGPYDPAGRASTIQPPLYAPQAGIVEAENAPHLPSKLPRQAPHSAPAPLFYYQDINIYEPLEKQIQIPSHLPLFQHFPGLADQCRKVIVTAVYENLNGMVERSIACAVSLTTEIINKDFAQIPDETQMRKAYLQMMRSITAAIGMITTREPLSTTIITYVRNIFNHQIQQLGQVDPEFLRLIDQCMMAIIEKNVDFACCFVVKHACEKATGEIEKRMEEALQRRRTGVKLDIPPDVLEILDKMPKALRPLDRPLKDEEMGVYDLFNNQIFGFKPSVMEDFSERRTIPVNRGPVGRPRAEPGEERAIVDNSSFQRQAEAIFREWMNVCTHEIRPPNLVACHLFGLMEQYCVVINEESILKIIKTCLDISTDVTYRLLGRAEGYHCQVTPSVRNRCYYTIDAFSKLVCSLIRNARKISGTEHLQLLHRTMEILSGSLLADHDNRRTEFNGLPFLRIFITMLKDLCQPDSTLIALRWNIIEIFCHTLYYIQPRRAPAFAFHWLEVIGHRVFISELLADSNAPSFTRAIYTQLLLAQLKFLAPSLRNVHLSKALDDLYKGTLRVMLIVLHDFPELFCEYNYVICDVIPANCVQLRNLVLSAFPRSMRLPDPFSQNFATIEALPEMDILPKVPFEMFNLIPETLRNQLDAYLTTRGDVTFLPDLANKLESSNIPGSKYNVPVLNSIINFVGVRAITQLKENQLPISISSIAHSAYMDVFQSLAVTFCSEGRYLLFNALANQLRYPNAQTHYFACTLLYLFETSTNDVIKEQITRILVERLISSRPHPWGLLITYIELIKNEQYKFWSYDFVLCDPGILKMFCDVAKSCFVAVPPKIASMVEAESGGM